MQSQSSCGGHLGVANDLFPKEMVSSVVGTFLGAVATTTLLSLRADTGNALYKVGGSAGMDATLPPSGGSTIQSDESAGESNSANLDGELGAIDEEVSSDSATMASATPPDADLHAGTHAGGAPCLSVEGAVADRR